MRGNLVWCVIVLAACGGRTQKRVSSPDTASYGGRAPETASYGGSAPEPTYGTSYANTAPVETVVTGDVIQNLPAQSNAVNAETIDAPAARGNWQDITAKIPAEPAPPPKSPAELAAGNGVSAVAQVAAGQPRAPEQLVIEGWMGLEVEDVRKAAKAVRDRVTAAGGRIVTDTLGGSSDGWSAEMVVRIPPTHTSDIVEWIGTLGEIRSQRIEGTDVSRALIDQELALENHEITMKRLQELVQRPNLEMQAILQIENEMTRIRGAIEKIKGEHRWLQDRVAMATLHLTIGPRPGVALGEATTKLYPGPRLATLMLLRPGDRQRTRIGGGLALHLGVPRALLEVDVFAGPDEESPATLVSIGGAFYSDHFGRGKRAFLNPYLGLRAGYAYLETSRLLVAGDVGVELFKHRYVMVDANVRMAALIGDETDVALVGGLSAVIAF